MRFTISLLLFALSIQSSFSQTKKETYEYTLDLTHVVDDQIKVELKCPQIKENEITFYLPKIIPGTYAVQDYGRFVSAFEAFDKKGKALAFEKLNANAWRIRGAKKLDRISYWIEDSFDTEITGPQIF